MDDPRRAVSIVHRLAGARWVFVRQLRLVPFLGGRLAGEPFGDADIAVTEAEILFRHADDTKYLALLAGEVSRLTGSHELAKALMFSFGRSVDMIDRYFQSNFAKSEEKPPVDDPSRDDSGRSVRISKAEEPASAPPPDDMVADGLPPAHSEGATKAERSRPREEISPVDELARHLGLSKRNNVYVGADGDVLQRSETFQGFWELWSSEGRLEGAYWVRRCSSERRAIEVPAEIWERVVESPETVHFALYDPARGLRIVPGTELLALRRDGVIEIFPAVYRLVWHE